MATPQQPLVSYALRILPMRNVNASDDNRYGCDVIGSTNDLQVTW
jgi:hypothetical protein